MPGRLKRPLARVAITRSVTFAAEKRQLTSTRFICDRRIVKSDNLQYNTMDRWVDSLIDQVSDRARVAITRSVTFAAEKRQLTSTQFICDRRIVFKNLTIINIIRWIAGAIVSSTVHLMKHVLF